MAKPAMSPRGRSKAAEPTPEFRPLTPALMDRLAEVLRGGWGAGCWCLYPRLGEAGLRALPGPGSASQRRRQAMAERAGQTPAPGLLAFSDGQPVGWVAIAPRAEFQRLVASRATPPVDGQAV
ncbi:MAG: hypothetical protein FJX68_03615 [Alphaproteobacteria bacterium]|nr:hypothetical protein [Alphaproteobacteria bacterium]